MKKTIREYIEQYVADGFTGVQARNLTAQVIIISKIAKSNYVDKILLKGGVVMYNIMQERRRATIDLDFDFIRYDISSDQNIKMFVNVLNRNEPNYKVEIVGDIVELHQQDYHGKRINLLISDTTESIKFKLDIGVHTLLAIDQERMCFLLMMVKTYFCLLIRRNKYLQRSYSL